MSHSIPSVAVDANTLFTTLTTGLAINLSSIPAIELETEFDLGNEPTLPEVSAITLADLTTQEVGGTGVFDALMQASSAHLEAQFQKQRITGKEYAEVYLGTMTAAMQFAVAFVMGKDQARLQNLQTLETIKVTRAQRLRALADIQLARAQLQQAMYATKELELKTHIALNQYASTKMDLVLGFHAIMEMEGKQKLVGEQYETQRAQTRNTLSDGSMVEGLVGNEIRLSDAKIETALEELDTTRANTKETLRDGTAIQGLVAIEKEMKELMALKVLAEKKLTEEQYEIARAETKDTLSDGSSIAGLVLLKKQTAEKQMLLASENYEIARAQVRDSLSTGGAFAGLVAVEKLTKEAQRLLMNEQVDTTRAQTKDTLQNGQAVTGLAAVEKQLKTAQKLLVSEQYEGARGQVRGTLSTGEVITGLTGSQISLYNEQVTSYKRDAEYKFTKSLLDTWTARKTIDEGVEVPSNIDTAAINSAITAFRSRLPL